MFFLVKLSGCCCSNNNNNNNNNQQQQHGNTVRERENRKFPIYFIFIQFHLFNPVWHSFDICFVSLGRSVLSLFIFLLFSIGNPNQFVISDDDSCPFFRLFIMEEYSFGRQNQKKTNFYYHQNEILLCFLFTTWCHAYTHY